jgi:hypothetical protein
LEWWKAEVYEAPAEPRVPARTVGRQK